MPSPEERLQELQVLLTVSNEHWLTAEDEIYKYKSATAFCDEHIPNGGHVSGCLKCALIEMSRCLSSIDYLIGVPNEMGVSVYDVEMDPEGVIERLTAYLEEHDLTRTFPSDITEA